MTLRVGSSKVCLRVRIKLILYVFDFFIAMTSTACVISWAVICATYLRFYRAVRKQRLEKLMVTESQSRLQPYLAIYGLSICLLFRKTSFTGRNSQITR